MGLLGDFLESLFGPHTRFRTVRATIRHHTYPARARAAVASDRRAIGRRRVTAAPEERVDEEVLSIWLAPPDRARVEHYGTAGGRPRPSLEVVNGERAWQRDHEGHVFVEGCTQQRKRRPGLPTEVERHFGPALIREFCQHLALESLGTVQAAGRTCVRLRAVPRGEHGIWPHWLPREADEYELHADPVRASLLAILAHHGGEVFAAMAVTEVSFDEPLDDALFRYEPSAGEQVAPAPPISETLSLEAAIARMSFIILVPTRVPDAEHAELGFHYSPPRGPGGAGRQSLTLFYHNFESAYSLWLTESDIPDPNDVQYDWEEFEVHGRRMRLSDPGESGLRLLSLEQQGTYVEICSDLERGQLLDLAASLVPAEAGKATSS